VVSNEIPRVMTELRGWQSGRFRRSARATAARYIPLMQVNFVEANPGSR
jgi:hypothetical protein